MSYTPEAKPTSSFTKQALSYLGRGARFGRAKFGIAQFGAMDDFVKQALSTAGYTKQALPITGARFGTARFGSARFGSHDNYSEVAKPTSSFTKQPLP